MTRLGKFEILSSLGSGATAEVYRAHDTVLGRDVALKVLKPALVADLTAFERFVQEARAAAVLFHPHIATVLDMGESDGRYFIAMRYYPGRSLDHIIKEQGPLSWEEALRMVEQVGSALDYAHGEGFLHRDVKPSNILRTPQGEYILTDFGLTRAMMSTGLTSHTGAVLGHAGLHRPRGLAGQAGRPRHRPVRPGLRAGRGANFISAVQRTLSSSYYGETFSAYRIASRLAYQSS